ncbi:GNAT family N-acetyltransferase [Paenibacillus alkalitolerans]|uniref:GNAT family N-acetyltransferase n=1 Tax=Paenibacillus alkalitolerans TaxID=2799335 RepID=UPI0018F28699|nr:GNAT family N-acetyltransferase [Paenibacillus alkalitolerans]
MEYVRITNIQDPLFAQLHRLMQEVFPPEEVLEFSLWEEPLKDNGLRVCVAVQDGKVVGATEYRYYEEFNVAMTDFTIIGKAGAGIGPFLWQQRQSDLEQWAAYAGRSISGMFAEIYNPYISSESYSNITPMNPYVRREVLAHMGYKRLDFDYVHPSWLNDGEAVSGLDLCFLPYHGQSELPAELIVAFLERYYSVLSNKPAQWLDMIERLKNMRTVSLLPM